MRQPGSSGWRKAGHALKSLLDYSRLARDAASSQQRSALDEQQTHTGGRADCRVSWNFRSHSFRQRGGCDGSSISREPASRNRARRLHQHHARLGSRGHHGYLHRRKSFWRPSESRGHPHSLRCSAAFPGARFSLIPSRKPQEHFSPPLWYTKIICRPSTSSIRNWKKRPASSRLSPPFPLCRRQDFWIR